MTDWLAGAVFILTLIAALVVVHRPFGDYLAGVVTSRRHIAPERVIYRVGGIDADAEQSSWRYLRAVLSFSFVSVVVLYVLLRVQQHFWTPYAVPKMTADQAFNTAVSFVTNTNWQSYSGESALGYVVQMVGLTVQNFLSAAVGVSVAVALVRAFTRNKSDLLGNFWVDLTRISIRVLLPLSLLFAIVFVGAGMIQNLHDYSTVHTLAGGTQTITGGPVASQEAIKELGTNGGGFFNANSAHPFENPTAWTNWLEIFLLLVIPFSLPRAFGRLGGRPAAGSGDRARHGGVGRARVVLTVVFQGIHHGTVRRRWVRAARRGRRPASACSTRPPSAAPPR